MKRFYKNVSYDKKGDNYRILLDDRALNTKSGQNFLVPSVELAKEIVTEWVEQDDVMDPQTMPLTQIVNTKIDHVSKKRAEISRKILKYLDTDLLCYIASEPSELVNLQNYKWGKWRSWFEHSFDCTLKTTTGLVALSQSDEIHDKLSSKISSLSDDEFTVLQIIVPLSGSLILAFAMIAGKATSQDVIDACFIEEDYKNTLYNSDKCGADPYIDSKKKSAIIDFKACETYLKSLNISSLSA